MKDYGQAKKYTPKQIYSTADRHGLQLLYICYAMAMFSEQWQFEQYHREIGEDCNYGDMRSEVGEKFFGGETSFDMSYASGTSFESSGYDSSDISSE